MEFAVEKNLDNIESEVPEQELTIIGFLKKIIYRNDQTGYTVGAFEIESTSEETPIVGTLYLIDEGDYLELHGKWTNHKKYGRQFKVTNFHPVIPSSKEGIIAFLASSKIPYLGPVTSRRLVEQFGTETLSIIDAQPELLETVSGIGRKRAKLIAKTWAVTRKNRETLIFLLGHGISPSKCNRIVRKYSSNAISVLQKNPYQLSTDIDGIGFLTADRIARLFGIPEDSMFRVEAGIIHALRESAEEGHTYLPREVLVTRCLELLNCQMEKITDGLINLEQNEKLVIDPSFSTDDPAVYLTFFYQAELQSSLKLFKLLTGNLSVRPVDLTKAVNWVEDKLDIRLAHKQKQALQYSVSQKIMILTGGPGTGKTTTVNSILHVHQAMHRNVKLAAPTGRAAKRMSEVTGHEAKTIHRLLEYNTLQRGFLRNEENQLEGDLFIIDESSMIDILLFYHLMQAIPENASVIFVGDVNQLPSVGPGNVLKDLIQSGRVPVVELNQIFRQAQQSKIVTNAHRINWGEMPIFNLGEDDQLSDFYFIKEHDPNKVLEKIILLVTERIPARFGFHPIRDVQVLSPMNKGITGVHHMNESLQANLNPTGKTITKGNRIFRLHDKVMQIRNNYDKEIYNGDIGIVQRIDETNMSISVRFDQRELSYTYEELDELVLSYAISVHKSQGCEFNAVIIPLLTQHYMLLQRNLLYTGITRGKKLVVLIGTPRAVAIAVKNDRIQTRYCLLNKRLQESLGKES